MRPYVPPEPWPGCAPAAVGMRIVPIVIAALVIASPILYAPFSPATCWYTSPADPRPGSEVGSCSDLPGGADWQSDRQASYENPRAAVAIRLKKLGSTCPFLAVQVSPTMAENFRHFDRGEDVEQQPARRRAGVDALIQDYQVHAERAEVVRYPGEMERRRSSKGRSSSIRATRRRITGTRFTV